ncbi:MAG: glycosyltransferase family 4 protein [Candidatus Brocadia sp.]|nr:glycosyltransferase family 4 protein [Candidatus Brocadia sp.]
MLGPDRKVKGGISSVVNVYFDSILIDKYSIVYISTHVDGSKFKKLIQFISSVVLFFYQILFHKIDIVHIHSASRSSFYRKSLLVLFSKIFQKKVILHIHGGEFKIFYFDESNFIKKWFIRKIINLADVVIAISFRWKEDLEGIIGSEKKIKVIYNPVKLPIYTREYNNLNTVKILLMGKLGKGKGVYDLLDISKDIIVQFKNIKFVLCGDGEVEKVKTIVAENGLMQYFEIPGWITDKEKYFKEANIYVLPSYNEGLPMSILEAASYGLPVISTPVGGIGEVIEDDADGFLINPGDTEALKEKILLLVNSVELRTRMGREALRIVKEKFEVNKIVEQLNNIYQAILN